MKALDWLKDVLPNMLFLASAATFDDRAADSPIHVALKRVRDAADGASFVDGTLVSLEGIGQEDRVKALDALKDDGLFEAVVAEGFAHALGLYPEAPGRWLIQPYLDGGLHLDPELGQRHLHGVVSACFHGQSEAATRAKVLFISQYMMEGRIHFPAGSREIELLTRPLDLMTEDERALVDGWARATFGALYSAQIDDAVSHNDHGAKALEWALSFWRSNFRLFPCREWPARPVEALAGEDIDRVREELEGDADAIAADFDRRSLAIDPDLYDPDRYEVLVGLAAKGVRLARIASSDPLLWAPEVVTPLLRQVVECLIVTAWLVKSDSPEFFVRFKEYGRGSLKLLKLHLERAAEDDPAQEALLDVVTDEVNADLWEEFQTIDLSGGFSGKNIRQMAIDTDLKREYDLVFAPASSEDHGEWTALDRYHLSRCGELLHRLHRLPSIDLPDVVRIDAVRLIISFAQRTVSQVLDCLESDPVS